MNTNEKESRFAHESRELTPMIFFRFENFPHIRLVRGPLSLRHSYFSILMIRVHLCPFVVKFLLQNQHAIAVAVEAVSFTNCFLVRAEEKLAAGKCAHQH